MRIADRAFIFALGLCLAAVVGRAQLTRPESEKDDMQSAARQAVTSLSVAGVPMDGVVDPKQYVVGPSDVIGVSIWTSPAISFPLTVTPEGTLIIPTVGEVAVAGQTLAMAKETIIGAARKKYLSAAVSATLTKPRPVVVTVQGAVRRPGAYTLSAASRAGAAIAEANGMFTSAEGWINTDAPVEMSKRNIVVRHNDGSEEKVDLQKFLAVKDNALNPYLREGDVISVPVSSAPRNVVGVYGEVMVPGRYEFVEGDRAADLIAISGGFSRAAMKDSIMISRLAADGNSMTGRHLNDLNEPLQPGDRIIVSPRTELRQDFRVTVLGEVTHPGTYPITRSSTMLSEVISMAGGFTESASLQTARITRHSVPREQMAAEKMVGLRGAIGSLDSAEYSLENTLRLNAEPVNADFVKLFRRNDKSADLPLRDNDTIYVPVSGPTVYVFGQVVFPGHIALSEGKDARYYIETAGGFTDRARKGDVRVVKALTRQWLEPDKTTIEPGDYVWVPTDPDRPFAYYMTVASQAASVLSVVIGITVLVIQANK